MVAACLAAINTSPFAPHMDAGLRQFVKDAVGHTATPILSPPRGIFLQSLPAEPQVCSTAVMPMRAPRCLGSAAMMRIVSADALNRRSNHGLVLVGDVADPR